ncbi:TIGR02678 family protein [Paenibacillus pinihumi]|uniref:TIGR02678 family protein n=1 Tax=Paenibacillus pinihumi TaxID=669462 RepID=UPI0004205D5E|nr:TIGR02678 family protein [Paenibacillus pinihumi]
MKNIRIGDPSRVKRRRTNIVEKKELVRRKRMCMNALLNRPWIAKETDAELYYWIKDQYTELRKWFLDFAGYTLFVNAKLAKLEKAPAVAHSWMGFQEFREPLDYALFTYCLWYLEDKGERDQILLTDMIKEIREYMLEQDLEVDWKNYFHRLSMARAIKKLKILNVIHAIDGSESSWASNNDNNALYECNSYSRYVMRNFPKDLLSYTSLDEMSDTINYGDTLEEMNRRRKHYLYRRFLLEPIVLDQHLELNPLYFHGQRNNVLAQLKEMFGWAGSRYKEGLLFFELDMANDAELFPTFSSISDLTILIFNEIRQDLSKSEPTVKIESNGTIRFTKGEIERMLIRLQKEFGEFWTTDHRKMKSVVLAELICDHLIEWNFGEWETNSEFFLLNAAAGRWIAEYGLIEIDG